MTELTEEFQNIASSPAFVDKKESILKDKEQYEE